MLLKLLGTLLKSLFGGLMAEHLHWSLIFWANVPMGIGAAVLTYIYLARIPRHDRRHRLDLLGAVLMMASAIPILLALTWGGTRYSWTSPTILALVAASSVLSVLFVGFYARVLRSDLVESENQDFVRTARAKGLKERSVVLVHAARNALLPVATVIGLQLGSLLSGAVLTETTFNLAGVGRVARQGKSPMIGRCRFPVRRLPRRSDQSGSQ